MRLYTIHILESTKTILDDYNNDFRWSHQMLSFEYRMQKSKLELFYESVYELIMDLLTFKNSYEKYKYQLIIYHRS